MGDDSVACVSDGSQVVIQAQAEPDHADVHDDADRQQLIPPFRVSVR